MLERRISSWAFPTKLIWSSSGTERLVGEDPLLYMLGSCVRVAIAQDGPGFAKDVLPPTFLMPCALRHAYLIIHTTVPEHTCLFFCLFPTRLPPYICLPQRLTPRDNTLSDGAFP